MSLNHLLNARVISIRLQALAQRPTPRSKDVVYSLINDSKRNGDVDTKRNSFNPQSKRFHLITDEIFSQCAELQHVKIGMMNVFLKHTSASLTLNENADYTVREDFEAFFNHAVPENEPYYQHLEKVLTTSPPI